MNLPRLTYAWVRGWRKEYRVSLRKPNTKYKLTKERLIARLTVMWRANLRIRWLAWFALGREVQVWGADQKPLYMNEGGHTGVPTLHLAGCELAVAKEVIAQSRARVSGMTVVTSNQAEANGSLPLGLLFKGKTPRTLKRLPANLGPQFIFQFAPKGSYRAEQVADFLNRALPAWTPEREAAKDWRILYLDAYKPHFADVVVRAAWAHGFVCLWHGAGTTGVCQVNDTHLHATLERLYLAMETESTAYMRKWGPTKMSRDKADVAFDLAAVWRQLDHKLAVKGHKHNGLTNALNGDEDGLLAPEVRQLWEWREGPRLRSETKQEIQGKVERGELGWDWDSIQKLVGGDSQERALGSYATQGRELEAAQQEGEQVWQEAGNDNATEEEREERKQQVRAEKMRAASANGVVAHNIGGVVAPAKASDSDAAKRVAADFAKKLQHLEALNRSCAGLDLAPFKRYLERKKRQLLKSQASGEGDGDQMIRRYLSAQAEEEREQVEKKRAQILAQREKMARQDLWKKKLKNKLDAQKIAKRKAEEEKAAKAVADKAAQALLERNFKLEELKSKGNTDKASRQARIDYLERWRRVCGLGANVADCWLPFRDWCVDWVVKRHPRNRHAELWAMGKRMKEKGDQGLSLPFHFSQWVEKQWAFKPIHPNVTV